MTFPEFKAKYQKKEVQEVFSSTPQHPVISVLVQTYQQKDYIKQCLDSILMQETSFDFEVLIGEDGSKDGTREICLYYAQKYPKIIRLFLHHRENQIKLLGGATSNFNALYNFYSARGNFFAFCEGDDLWGDKTKLERQIKFLQENPTFSFTYHPFITINYFGIPFSSLEEDLQPKKDINQDDLKKVKHHPLLITMCFRKLADNVPAQFAQVLNIDSFLISYLGKQGKAHYRSDIKPSHYRKHVRGIWSERVIEKKYLSKILTYSKLQEYYNNEEEIKKYFKKRVKQVNRSLWMFYIKEKEFYKAIKKIRKII